MSQLDPPLGLTSVSDRGTLRPRGRDSGGTALRPADLGPSAMASERGPDPDPVFFQESGSLSPNHPGPIWVNHSASMPRSPALPEPQTAVQLPGLSAAG